MEDFSIVPIPNFTRQPSTSLWKRVADTMLANTGQAVYVPSNGRNVSAMINVGNNNLRRYIDNKKYRMHTSRDDNGGYFWIEGEIATPSSST